MSKYTGLVTLRVKATYRVLKEEWTSDQARSVFLSSVDTQCRKAEISNAHHLGKFSRSHDMDVMPSRHPCRPRGHSRWLSGYISSAQMKRIKNICYHRGKSSWERKSVPCWLRLRRPWRRKRGAGALRGPDGLWPKRLGGDALRKQATWESTPVHTRGERIGAW